VIYYAFLLHTDQIHPTLLDIHHIVLLFLKLFSQKMVLNSVVFFNIVSMTYVTH